MKLQQQSHATLKSKLQDHKTIGESIFVLFKGKWAISSLIFFQWKQLIIVWEPSDAATVKKKTKLYFLLVALLFVFLDEMATQLEPTTAPNELLVSVPRWHLLFNKIFRLINSKENAANEEEEHFLLSCRNKT